MVARTLANKLVQEQRWLVFTLNTTVSYCKVSKILLLALIINLLILKITELVLIWVSFNFPKITELVLIRVSFNFLKITETFRFTLTAPVKVSKIAKTILFFVRFKVR